MPKVTFTAEVIKFETNKPAGPVTYEKMNLKLNRSLGAYNLTDSNVNFTDEAKWHSSQTGKCNYKSSDKLTKPAIFATKIPKLLENPSWRIAKEDGPAPGSYNDHKAYNYTTKKQDFVDKIKFTSKRVNFTDSYALLYKNNPNMCTYKEAQTQYDKTHKRCRSQQSQRV